MVIFCGSFFPIHDIGRIGLVIYLRGIQFLVMSPSGISEILMQEAVFPCRLRSRSRW